MDSHDRQELAENILVTLPMFFNGLVGRGDKTELKNKPKPECFHLLLALRDNPDMTMTALSKHMNMPKPNATFVVDKLVRDGLVERVFSEHDRRLVQLRLTEEGTKQVEIRRRVLFDNAVKRLDMLSDQDAAELTEHINGIACILKKYKKRND